MLKQIGTLSYSPKEERINVTNSELIRKVKMLAFTGCLFCATGLF